MNKDKANLAISRVNKQQIRDLSDLPGSPRFGGLSSKIMPQRMSKFHNANISAENAGMDVDKDPHDSQKIGDK